jgi:hypothetical protein
MPLSRRDIEQIRRVVREEVDTKRWRDQQHRSEERAAIPIPDSPFVDIYDARRLLNGTGVTANAWIRRGRLTRHDVDGRLGFSRAEIDAILADQKKPRR